MDVMEALDWLTCLATCRKNIEILFNKIKENVDLLEVFTQELQDLMGAVCSTTPGELS